mmetsp:Transcript_1186/g.2905  ORF Transcript_1186/g.2905 Transcript_1186/m.2905 type:complete len:251 (-) Transcript_1186:140-892(-)|eukprot:CAMPEP_0170619904 /NCGR_PEP_ID=MMETSP0224-20130122/27767_1 /TAXON_ID=285029 /ORGANISM="Togula jolla, Strain CCCM 725" /LENGTH=250 /DNA_ID=CAMNT_0010946029 /DNA_START=42 /DNA_END=794 /DNA_ORIENTATION=-
MSQEPFSWNSLIFLDTHELAQLEAVSDSIRRSSGFGFAWRLCDAREHPQWSVSQHLYEVAQRHELVKCRALLKNTFLAKGLQVDLTSVVQARLLQEALRKCRLVAEEHRTSGGRIARVLVGKFRIGPPSSAQPCAFALGVEGPGGCKGELRISLALEDMGSRLVVSALHSRAATLQKFAGGFLKPAEIKLDLCSVSVLGDFGVRDMLLKVDGLPSPPKDSWFSTCRMSSGDLSDGILCVLSVRDSPTAFV